MDNYSLNNAEKVEDNVASSLDTKATPVTPKKKRGGIKGKLACVGFGGCFLVILLLLCSFLWLGGHIQKFTCRLVQEDSQIWQKLSCSGSKVTEQGDGEYKYNIIENGGGQGGNLEQVITNVVEKSSPAVVAIAVEADDFSEEQVIGSGFIVTSNGLIVTNQHVVSDEAQTYVVLLAGQDEPIKVEKIYRDAVNDIAIVQVNQDNLPTVPLGDSDKIKVGQTAIAIGNPLGTLEGTVTTGIVSGLNRDVEVGSGFFSTGRTTFEGVIQTDAPINPGNSGGPLLNSNGEVIGVNFATIQGADGLSFALPINRIKDRIDELNEFGDFRIPFLGIEYRQRVVIHEDESIVGALVSQVIKGGPAEQGGMKVNDVVIKFDGKDLEGEALANIIQHSEVGKEVEVIVIRDKKEITLKVTVGDRADF